MKKPGFTLLVVLILMMLLLALSYFYSDALFTELRIARANKGAAIAFSLAEAGTQEAIYRIQNDPTAKNNFLNTTNGLTTFSHDPALIDNGAYNVSIQNVAKGVATITAVGQFKIGALKTARREIKVGIAQANINLYNYDGAIFTGGGAGESIADADFWYAPVQIFGGALLSNRDINFKFGAYVNIEGSDVKKCVDEGDCQAVSAGRNVVKDFLSQYNCNCAINDDGDPTTPQCDTNPSCTPLVNQPPKIMPPIDFDSSSPNSYKNQAIAAGQYFPTAKEFLDLIPKNGSKTFDGVVYVDDSLTINDNQTITVNGVLASSGSINISKGQLITAPAPSGIAGGITQKDFIVGKDGNYSGTGLIYSGDRTQIDSSNTLVFDLTGGILARRTWITGYRVVNIHFDANVVNITLDNPNDTPVIEINHWEEEY